MRVALSPQPGPQEDFAACEADIAIFGGAAGGGKSYALLLEPLRFAPVMPGFQAVIFRRTTTDIRKPGGLWDESCAIYSQIGGTPLQQPLEWVWTKGGKIKFGHLEHESTKYDWHGAQLAFIGFDELTHFSRSQFFYMLSRLRSGTGIQPYIRGTCNPDADSWVAHLIAWWIDQDTGLAIPERSGVIRWFIREDETLLWADSKEECVRLYGDSSLPMDHPDQVMPLSFTFIHSSLDDNQALLKKDPSYRSKLKGLDRVSRARLLGANWKIRPSAGMYFQRSWCEFVDVAPPGVRWVRAWDLAATEKTDGNDPDWTIGVKMGRHPQTGRYYIAHAARGRLRPQGVLDMIKGRAAGDGNQCTVSIPQDPGQAGKTQVAYYANELSGYKLHWSTERGDKLSRFTPFSSQAEAGNVVIVRWEGMDDYLDALESFPPDGDRGHDDDADATARAFAFFQNDNRGILDYYREEAEKLKQANEPKQETTLVREATSAIEQLKAFYQQ